ncbi:Hsp70 family protein [Skermania sp. ID1734]|uniref:Hsp70 family protein n=1 Tax=Skermania sp. ID1734 TaxID=2597516 RepID=UPI00117D851C|nr:Hsp70 family protein [Skermania sp. ID1734]TSD93524.1 Hsp70 family protein [Skermania sp. ID1734]
MEYLPLGKQLGGGSVASGWALAIDFGTSNTAAAQLAAGSNAVDAVALSHASNLMSSAVYVEGPESILVGDVALDRALGNPAAFLPAPKRTISHGMTYVAGYDLPSSMPVAAVLRSVISRAVAQHAGQFPERVVLTHPEAWSRPEVDVLIDAARRAGVPVERIATVSEPRAAAAWYARSASTPTGARIAVFDFGGGTLDVAVLAAAADGTFSVLSARGDNGLGGKNLDSFIRRWVDDQLQQRNARLLATMRAGASPDSVRMLDDSIRRAKELLSEAPSASIAVTVGGEREVFVLTREEFDDIIGPEIDRAVALTRAALADAGVGADGVQALYLTGGSSRIPLVHSRLGQLGAIATLDDPKTVVAKGALVALAAGAATPAVARPEPPQRPAPQAPAPRTVAPPAAVQAPGPSAPPKNRRKLVLAAVGIAVVAVAVGVGIVVSTRGGDSSPNVPAVSESRSPAADEQAIRDLIGKYIVAVNNSDHATLTALRCSSFVAETTTTDPFDAAPNTTKYTVTLQSVSSLTIIGDNATARATVNSVAQTAGATPSSIDLLFDLSREGGQWKVCRAE